MGVRMRTADFDGRRASAAVRSRPRLEEVRRVERVHRRVGPALDRLTHLSAHLLDAPVSLLTLVDSDHQLFASSYGLDEPLRSAARTPIEYSICQYAVGSGSPLVVSDTRQHPLLVNHPAVTEFGIAAYAGMPLVVDGPWTLGTLCVMDFAPREWIDDRLGMLSLLASICLDEMDRAALQRDVEFAREWPRLD